MSITNISSKGWGPGWSAKILTVSDSRDNLERIDLHLPNFQKYKYQFTLGFFTVSSTLRIRQAASVAAFIAFICGQQFSIIFST